MLLKNKKKFLMTSIMVLKEKNTIEKQDNIGNDEIFGSFKTS